MVSVENSSFVLLFSLLNGIYHGIGADHMLAVSTLARKGARRADVARLGLRFGMAHAGVLLVLCTVAVIWNFSVSPAWESRAEIFGGALLILLGAWTFLEWLREAGHIHSHQHTHAPDAPPHTHYHFHLQEDHPKKHTHPHTSTLLGALFAFSGLRALLITAVPIMQSRSLWLILLYLGVFGLGIILSMTVWGLIFGSALKGERSGHWVSLTLSLSSVALGMYWIGTAGGPV